MTDQQYSFIEAVKEFQYHLNRCNEMINRYFRHAEQSIEPPTGMYSSNSPAPSSYEGEGYGDGYSPTSPSYIPPPSPKGDQILLDSTTPKSDQILLDSTTPKSDQTLLDFTTQSSTTNDPPPPTVINHHFEKNCCQKHRRSASPKYILVNSPGHYSKMRMYRHAEPSIEPPPRGIYLPPPSYEGEGYSPPSYIPPPPQSKQTLSPTVINHHFGKNCCREHQLANPNYIVYNSPGHFAANRYSPYHHFVNGHYSSSSMH